MVQLNETFDPLTVEIKDYTPLPQGTYPVVITGSQLKKSKAGDDYIRYEYTVMDGDFINRKIFDNLNLFHKAETPKAIARETLAKICKATGYTGTIQDTAELHNKSMAITLVVKVDGQYTKNEIKGYEQLNNAHIQPAQPAATSEPVWAQNFLVGHSNLDLDA